MKVVILAGGLGTRIMEFTKDIPKPMIEIGGKPLLWHIMKHYSYYNYRDFIIAAGYKIDVIRESLPEHYESDWSVEIVDTGLTATKAARLKMLSNRLNKTFMLTWGDGVSDINLDELLKMHRQAKNMVTISAISVPSRFGHIDFEKNKVSKYVEKDRSKKSWINGAFFVVEPKVLDYITNKDKEWETDIFQSLILENELGVYPHNGFWQCMDETKDKVFLEYLWQSSCPWNIWRYR